MTHDDGVVPGSTGHRLDRMTTVQARTAMGSAAVALIPVGATEQHGPNLVCGIDWMAAEAVAGRVAAEVDPLAVVVPPLPFGLSGHHLDFPGTLHVSAATFSAVCKDVARSLARHGIRKVVFVNGHRGNENVLGVLVTELTYELGIEAASAFWMTQAAEEVARHKKTPRWGHACEIETSLALAISPDLVGQELEPGDLIEEYGAFEDNYAAHALVTARTFASRTRNGAFGDATLATAEAGQEILDAAVTRTAAFVRDFAARPPRGTAVLAGSHEGGGLLMEILLLFGVLFGLMAFGVPVFVSMAASALVTLAVTGLGAATVLPTTMVGGVDSFELLAIPFFVLVGELMNKAGLTQRIIDLLMFFLGRFRGGLAQASVGVNLFASGVSGSAPADAAAVSSVMLPAMRKEGYTPQYAAAVNASAAVVGPVMPPSIPMVFVALVTQLSLGQLFLGGVGPAILLAGSMVALIAYHAVKGKLPSRRTAPVTVGGGSGDAPAETDQRGLGRLFLDALPALLAPAFIVAGVFGGFATITEMAVLAALYVLVLGLVYRTLPAREIPAVLRDGAVFSSTIMILFAAVGSFTFVIAAQRVGDQVAEFVSGLDVGPTAFLLLSMVFFLVVGMVLDAVPAILIFLPIMLPVAVDLGVDPIHFGVLVVVNLMIGLLTPPVGALLYVLTKIGRVSFGSLVKETLPFVAVMLAGLLIMVLVPSIVTWLPDLFFGG